MNNKSLFVFVSVIETWCAEAEKFKFKETGGILIGYKDKIGNHVITHATGPGPKAYHGITYFEADNKYCQNILNKIFDLTEGALTFLGDWHTHPWGALKLSSRDIKTFKELAIDKRFGTPEPIMVIYRPGMQILSYKKNSDIAAYIMQNSFIGAKSLDLKIIENIYGYTPPVIVLS